MEQSTGLLIAFVIGLITSALVVISYERVVRPLLDIIAPVPGDDLPPDRPYKFYHLAVRQLPTFPFFTGRRPAWSIRGTAEVFRSDGSRAIAAPILVRWSSRPEPITRVWVRNRLITTFNPEAALSNWRVDVHSHENQLIPILIKYDGSPDCYLFSDLSYRQTDLRESAWRLGEGVYTLTITLFYETEALSRSFRLSHLGASWRDVGLQRLDVDQAEDGMKPYAHVFTIFYGLATSLSFIRAQHFGAFIPQDVWPDVLSVFGAALVLVGVPALFFLRAYPLIYQFRPDLRTATLLKILWYIGVPYGCYQLWLLSRTQRVTAAVSWSPYWWSAMTVVFLVAPMMVVLVKRLREWVHARDI